MPAVTRKPDPCSGHALCFPPRPPTSWAGTVFAETLNVVRETDTYAPHAVPLCVPHPGNISKGSPNVFCEGLPVARIGDPVNCGSIVVIGAGTVFANDMGGPGEPKPPPPPPVAEQHQQEQERLIELVAEAETEGNGSIETISDQHYEDGEEDQKYSDVRDVVNASYGDGGPVTVVEEDYEEPPEPPEDVPTGCSDIDELDSIPPNFLLSPNYTLADLTTHTLVSNYALRSQVGLTEKQIACNLRSLCVNVLEPLLQQFPDMRINSGFRYGTGRSQHYKGLAVDVSFPSLSTSQEFFDRAKYIRDNSAYDQFIFEQNRSIWYHLSFSEGANRRMVGTKTRAESRPRFPGLRRILV